MTLIEAIRTGHPLRRKNKPVWYREIANLGSEVTTTDGCYFSPKYFLLSYPLTAEDILATDWEVQEKRRALTWREIRAAYEYVSGADYATGELLFDLDMFKCHLGFTEGGDDISR